MIDCLDIGLLVIQDHSMNPPCQELVAKDLHGVEWNFRHIYRGKGGERIAQGGCFEAYVESVRGSS